MVRNLVQKDEMEIAGFPKTPKATQLPRHHDLAGGILVDWNVMNGHPGTAVRFWTFGSGVNVSDPSASLRYGRFGLRSEIV